MPKKKTKGHKSISLKQVSSKDFSIDWDAGRNTCIFRYKNGIGGELGCGVMDVVAVFVAGEDKVLVASVNYPARYACIEIFDNDGLDELVFAEPKDITEMFGQDFASQSPKMIAERLTKELG